MLHNHIFITLTTGVCLFSLQLIFISHQIIIPIIWTIIFVYLYFKNYIYIALNSYLLLFTILVAHKVNFGLIHFNNEVVYSSLMTMITFLNVFLYQEFRLKKYKLTVVFSVIISLILYILPVTYLIYIITFDVVITKDIVFAISQTNPQESIEFIQSNISFYWFVIIMLLLFVICYLLLKQEKKESNKIERLLLIMLIIISFIQVKVLKKEISLYRFFKDSAKEYKKELELFQETQKKVQTGNIKFNAKKVENNETYIILIGESLNKHHMSLYGYTKDTTPSLKKMYDEKSLLRFTNAYSNHTHTMPVLSLSLTEANQINKKSYFKSLNIIDILNKANITTYWISNQNIYGEWDNLVSIIAHQANFLISLNHTSGKSTSTQKYDGALIPEIEKVLNEKNNKTKIIFVHLMGSHADYSNRYPNEYNKFAVQLKNKTNFYDNSVLYNDYVVSSILKLLKKKQGVSGLIYMSDHADDVDADLGHNSALFTYEMTQIPLIMWFSEDYKNKYSNIFHTLSNQQSSLFSNDFLYDTILGITNIKSDHYSKEHDLSSVIYKLKPKHAYTLHGKKPYCVKVNQFYSVKNN